MAQYQTFIIKFAFNKKIFLTHQLLIGCISKKIQMGSHIKMFSSIIRVRFNNIFIDFTRIKSHNSH